MAGMPKREQRSGIEGINFGVANWNAPWPASFPSGYETLSGKFIIFASPGQRGLERRELLNGLAFVKYKVPR